MDIAGDDTAALQAQLNVLYQYENDVSTKIYHRSRIALFQLLLCRLIDCREVTNFGSALDIGCNAGFYSKVISDSGFREVFGIDINPDYVARANRAFRSEVPDRRVTFETGDATAIATDRRFDLILCTEVIEHTNNPEAVIDSIMALLAPGGIAVVSLPNALSLGYLTSYLGARLKSASPSAELRDHMKFPFYKGPKLFKKKGAKIFITAGVNCMFNDRLLLLLHRTSLIAPLLHLNFWLSRRWPGKYFAQFYFFALRRGVQA